MPCDNPGRAPHLLEEAVLERGEHPQPRAPALVDEVHRAVVAHLRFQSFRDQVVNPKP